MIHYDRPPCHCCELHRVVPGRSPLINAYLCNACNDRIPNFSAPSEWPVICLSLCALILILLLFC